MSDLVWVELDGSAPDHNLRELRAGLGGGVLLCAVVKANAYGHGAAQMVGLLPSADWLAVHGLEEGLALRALGVRQPILLLGPVPLRGLREAIRADLRLTLCNRESLRAIDELALSDGSVRVHLKVETGAGRQGIPPEEVEGFVRELRRTRGAVLEGVATHFANIEDTLAHEYAEQQLARFRQALAILSELDCRPPIVHTAATAAEILFPDTHFTMVRAGIGLYGLWPSRETYLAARMSGRRMPDLRPVLGWKTRITQIKTLPEGSYVGYGCTYRTTRPTRLGVLPVGYSDGYDRALGNSAHVLVHGRRAAVIGRVCMNLTMIDLTDIPQARLEDEVVLIGRSGTEVITAETMAGWAGTINYEVVARISPLLERRIVTPPR
jgi:alanine racemase